MWHPKGNHTNEHIYKIETDSQISRMNLRLPQRNKLERQEEEETGGILGEWHQRVHTALFKINDQQGLTVKHRELCSTSCGSPDGRAVLWKGVHVYRQLRTSAVHLEWPRHCQMALLQYKINIGNNTQQLGITFEHTGRTPSTCEQTRNPEEGWEKGSLFCLHWECQLANDHCKEQQSGAQETSRQQWPKLWSTHPWACCQGNYT